MNTADLPVFVGGGYSSEMSIIQLLHTCFRSILRNRMRSLLTSLGVIIGVGSVIIMVPLDTAMKAARLYPIDALRYE